MNDEEDIFEVTFRYRDGRPPHTAKLTKKEFDRYMRDIDKAARRKVLARAGVCPVCGGATTCGQTVHYLCGTGDSQPTGTRARRADPKGGLL